MSFLTKSINLLNYKLTAGADGDDIGRMNVVTDDEVQNIAGTSQSNDEDDHDGPLLPALEIQPVAGPSTSRNYKIKVTASQK